MIPAFVLKLVLVAVALIVIVVLVRSFFTKPQRGSARPGRLRLPRYVAITAAVLLVLGLAAGLLGFGSGNMRDPAPFRIASVGLVVAGLLVLLAYRNRYIELGRDAVVFRTIFGVERRIRHADIVSRRVSGTGGRRMLVITAADGTRLRVNASRNDVSALLAAAEARTR